MSSKAMSPGAMLLRKSRLISLPPPIPPPTAYTSLRSGRTFPTQQAISTPASSHCRGDWGLKRNLPLKVTQQYLKYNELDTIEHRTTFESAHGEVMALRRWQEMDIPITFPGLGKSFGRRRSAFDEIDEIDIRTGKPASAAIEDHGIPLESTIQSDESKSPYARRTEQEMRAKNAALRATSAVNKWRFESPYLQSLPPRALRAWLLKKVRPRREEFITFLKRNQYLQQSSKLSSPTPNHEPSPEDLAHIKIDLALLRNDPLVLESLIISFLDLPKESPPPATHPSAGLQYTRSSAYMANLPFSGPEIGLSRTFPGRQLQSRGAPLAGVGGIVAKVTASETQPSPTDYTTAGTYSSNDRYESAHIRDNREITRWYRPLWATIDPDGAIGLEVFATQPPAQDYDGPGSHVAQPEIERFREMQRERELQLQAQRQREDERQRRTMEFNRANPGHGVYDPRQPRPANSIPRAAGNRTWGEDQRYSDHQAYQPNRQWQQQQQQQQYDQPQQQQDMHPQQQPRQPQQAATPAEDVLELLDNSNRKGPGTGFW